MTPRRPRDYDLAGLAYDGAVLGANAWYLVHQHEAPLVMGCDDEVDAAVRADGAALEAIFQARAQQIHQLVWWRQVDRFVCTCGLVVRSLDRLADPLGHLDQQRWVLAETVVVKIDDTESAYLAACQLCGAGARKDQAEEARSWCDQHACASGPTARRDETLMQPRPELGQTIDDVFHHLRSAERRRAAKEGE